MKRIIFALVALVSLGLFWGCSNDSLVSSEDSQSLEPLRGGYYKIEAVHSGKVLDVSYKSKKNGANVHQWEYVGGDNQKWKLTHLGNYKYIITNKHSGKVLDVARADTSNWGNIHQWEYVGKRNQQWYIYYANDGNWKIISAHSGKVVDVAYKSTENWGNIHQWDYVGGDNQHWKFIPVNDTTHYEQELE